MTQMYSYPATSQVDPKASLATSTGFAPTGAPSGSMPPSLGSPSQAYTQAPSYPPVPSQQHPSQSPQGHHPYHPYPSNPYVPQTQPSSLGAPPSFSSTSYPSPPAPYGSINTVNPPPVSSPHFPTPQQAPYSPPSMAGLTLTDRHTRLFQKASFPRQDHPLDVPIIISSLPQACLRKPLPPPASAQPPRVPWHPLIHLQPMVLAR